MRGGESVRQFATCAGDNLISAARRRSEPTQAFVSDLQQEREKAYVLRLLLLLVCDFVWMLQQRNCSAYRGMVLCCGLSAVA